MAEGDSNLESILHQSWSDLEKATGEPNHPCRLGQLATVHAERGVAVRTVVLRRVDRHARRILCFADARSEKIHEIEADPRVAWLSYDSMMRMQIRWSGRANVIFDGDIVDDCWAKLNETQRDEYACAASPGTVLKEGWDRPGTPPVRLSAEEARRWFCLIEVCVNRLDWLQLNPTGHLRARFKWEPTGTLHSTWVVP
ncbi:MAG TPA: pyridoxamine 5'-phosphate oxidase family protein [Phycisphaerae bacterium]|nr:pyridoxamine 5'-phosphate oxidase family protein [Phycisphaerae bacterium]HRW52757.1 pyridoxamine 5'-phosphate oxidase family protein [Phycisphaerae bacterium]